MLDFVKLDLNDIGEIKHYFEYSESRSCDYTVGGVFIWRDYYETEYAIFNETIIFKEKFHDGITAFSVPLGKDFDGSLVEIREYCRKTQIPLVFCRVTNEALEALKPFFVFDAKNERDWSDYLYEASDLISLKGRKYNGQRNHINHFKRTYPDYSFKRITESNIGDTIEFYKRVSDRKLETSDIFVEGKRKVYEVLENFDAYGFIGGVLHVAGEIVAFSVGGIQKDTLYVHVEKADTDYRGSYQMIVNEFARHFAVEGVLYINREDDAGDEGLRRSKLSYRPCEIIDKYILTVKNI